MQQVIIDKATLLESIRLHNREIRSYGVRSMGLFGSFVKNAANEKSDIDLLVDFEPDQKTFDNFMELSFFLQQLFGRKVEMVTPRSLNKFIGPHILNEVENVAL